MKQSFTLSTFSFLICLFFILVMHQDSKAQDSTLVCEPDSAFLESGLIIFPPPYVNDTLGVGITREACINTPYEMTFQALTPGVINISGFAVSVDSISIDTVTNLPLGLTYSCSTSENCVIYTDSLSCIFLTGTPTAENQTGEYELKINLTAFTSIGPIELEYPNPMLAPGSYTLILNEEGSLNCEETTPVVDLKLAPENLNLYPNPVSRSFTLEWESRQNGQGYLQIMTHTGQIISRLKINYRQGTEKLELEVGHLSPGMYLVGVQSTDTRFWKRLIKQ